MEMSATVKLSERTSKDGKKYNILSIVLRSGYTIDIMDFNAVREVQNLLELSKLYGVKL